MVGKSKKRFGFVNWRFLVPFTVSYLLSVSNISKLNLNGRLKKESNHELLGNSNLTGLHVVVAHCNQSMNWIWDDYLADTPNIKSVHVFGLCEDMSNENLPPFGAVVPGHVSVGGPDHAYARFISLLLSSALPRNATTFLDDDLLLFLKDEHPPKDNDDPILTELLPFSLVASKIIRNGFACAKWIRLSIDGVGHTSMYYDRSVLLQSMQTWAAGITFPQEDVVPVCLGGNFLTQVGQLKKTTRKRRLNWNRIAASLDHHNTQQQCFMERSWAALLSQSLPSQIKSELRAHQATIHKEDGSCLDGMITREDAVKDLQHGGAVSDSPEPQTVLFFNVFFNHHNESNTWRIIKELLETRQAHPHIRDAMLHYLTIGEDIHKAADATLPSHLCDPCHHIGHLRQGHEVHIHEALYHHCRLRPMDRVVYFHTKGSLHVSPESELLRRQNVKGIFSDACNDTLAAKEYDLCCTQFLGIPWAHCPGNMFSASCEYVQKLHPPMEFARIRTDLHAELKDKVQNMTAKSIVFRVNDTNQREVAVVLERTRAQQSLLLASDSAAGIGRYASEHWIGSHPSLRPVSVMAAPLMRFPGVCTDTSWTPKSQGSRLDEVKGFQTRHSNLFRLEGRLYLYQRIYSQLPPNTSWVYDYYIRSSKQ